MSLIKLGELVQVDSADIRSTDHVLSDPNILARMADDSEILEQFKKFADNLKQIAPKAKDFLYFSAIMMHSAEAALIDADGKLKKDANGKEVSASWDKTGGSWKWVASDPSVLPYKNSNSDIFPEEELLKAHKKWVGRPLCLDHKSSSVDMIRGVIVDTYYDYKNKRVIALCALDKVNYPDLARKVSTGYATSVSMGTAVGKAICTDCGTVARVEGEFCDHMRKKSCYGEINVDLNPIELSIVVNGADPAAKIRHIVAAADSIAQYVSQKQAQLSKVSEDETKDIELATDIADGLEKVEAEISKLKDQIKQLRSNEEAEQAKHDSVVEAAAEDLVVKDATPMLESILGRLEDLDNKFNKLFTKTSGEETEMTTKNAYFQGAGGVNEPTPGKPKYEKEEADSIRNNQDKQMESPQETGPVDGLFPGDEALKKSLLRAAEVQERELKRQAALTAAKEAINKGAYYQGAGGANEPTPGKPKYPKEDAEKIREKDDKQMNGAPPFPGVGKIDGLYDKDLETKKKVLRAKLNAKFVKAARPDGSHDLGESRWQVYADKNLVFTATVNEITGNRAEALYGSVATKDFGRELMTKLKSESFEKVAAMYKGAQLPPPDAAPPMADPMADPMAGGDAPKDEGNSGNPQERISEISHELSNLAADLAQADEALNGKSNDLQSFDELAGGEAPEGMPAAASTTNLLGMQKKLSQALKVGVKQTLQEINSNLQELKLAEMLVGDEAQKDASDDRKQTINTLVDDACNDAKRTIADAYKLMGAFVKYARGTQSLVKRDKKELEMKKTAQLVMPEAKITATPPAAPGAAYKGPGTLPGAANTAPVALDHKLEQGGSPTAPGVKVLTPEEIAKGNAGTQWMPKPAGMKADDCMADDADKKEEEKKDENDLKVMPDGSMDGTPEEVGKAMKEKEAGFDLSTKEGRNAYRTKLAEKGLQFSDMLTKAHGKGGPTTQLDVKPTGDLAKVETLEETHKAMMDVATAPPKVRKMAEEIQKHVVTGAINPETDFDALIAQGLDSDAVKYWKALYGQAKDGGSQFAAELVKEHQKAKMAEEKESYKTKVARAYALAYEMAEKDMIGKDASSINTQVTEMIDWTDSNFDSLKRMVARQTVKTASAVPQVGMLGGGEVYLPAPEASESDLKVALEGWWANKRF